MSGAPVVALVDDIPVSKRFFAGGDTTVRGFSLDRLGDESTISPQGFPTGGNGVVVLNGEMRVGVVGPLQAVGFMDAGNVVARASRAAAERAADHRGLRHPLPFAGGADSPRPRASSSIAASCRRDGWNAAACGTSRSGRRFEGHAT